MAYRGDDAGDALEARTAEGLLRLVTGPGSVVLTVGSRTLQLGARSATLIEDRGKKSTRTQVPRDGKLYIARVVAVGHGPRLRYNARPRMIIDRRA